MFKIFSFIYWTSVIAFITIFTVLTLHCCYIWKKRHPNYKNQSKMSSADRHQMIARILCFTFIPGVNTIVACGLLMSYFDVIESVIKIMEEKYFPM